MAETEPDPERVIDVREINPRLRHTIIFQLFENLASGQSFRIRSDHDPMPLRRQFELGFAGLFSWEYLQQGPDIWQVRIKRTG